MSQFKKLLAVSIIAVLPVMNDAHALSSLISLQGGVAAPLQEYTISLDKLREGVAYNVQCTLESDNKTHQSENYVQFKSFGMMGMSPNFFVNDIAVAGGSGQAKISTTQASVFRTEYVRKDANSIVISNLDDADTISVKNCYALPSV